MQDDLNATPATPAVRTPEQIEARLRAEWRGKLESCVGGFDEHGCFLLLLSGWDVHELYTALVDPLGSEGCCAGCTRLPPGWCAACDRDRELAAEGT